MNGFLGFWLGLGVATIYWNWYFAKVIHGILSRLPPRQRAMRIIILGNEGQNMQIKDNGSGVFSLTPEDAAGNPAPLATGAVVVWSINDPSLASLSPAADGLSCAVSASGKLGATTVQASVAAVGTEPALIASGDLNVIAGDATQLVMTGTPN